MADRTNGSRQKVNSRHIPSADKNYLWSASAGQCSYPGCRKQLVLPGTDKDGAVTIGEIAHIFAHSENGPRPNPEGFNEKTNSYENLILLCPNHHRQVDGQSNTFTVSDLIKWKRDHESWVAHQVKVAEFTSADLEVIINWISDNSQPPSTDYTILPLAEKMAFNSMSVTTQKTINMGLVRVGEVKTFITQVSMLQSNFAERLLEPLKNLYEALKMAGHSSDVIFEELRQFACGHSMDFPKQAAGLAVVVYFFERCEIFEK